MKAEGEMVGIGAGRRLKPRLDGPSGLLQAPLARGVPAPLLDVAAPLTRGVPLAFGSRVSPAATKPACAG